MLQKLINKLNSRESCLIHDFIITDIKDIGYSMYSWEYELTCVECRTKKVLKETVLKKQIESNVMLELDSIKFENGNIKNSIERLNLAIKLFR